jgi:hypothetical protein
MPAYQGLQDLLLLLWVGVEVSRRAKHLLLSRRPHIPRVLNPKTLSGYDSGARLAPSPNSITS